MKIKFGEKSGLQDRKVKTEFVEFIYVPESRTGMQEYVLIKENGLIPGATEEPDLYRDAKINDENPKEICLTYPELSRIEVILTTTEEERKIREKLPQIEKNILFEIIG